MHSIVILCALLLAAALACLACPSEVHEQLAASAREYVERDEPLFEGDCSRAKIIRWASYKTSRYGERNLNTELLLRFAIDYYSGSKDEAETACAIQYLEYHLNAWALSCPCSIDHGLYSEITCAPDFGSLAPNMDCSNHAFCL